MDCKTLCMFFNQESTYKNLPELYIYIYESSQIPSLGIHIPSQNFQHKPQKGALVFQLACLFEQEIVACKRQTFEPFAKRRVFLPFGSYSVLLFLILFKVLKISRGVFISISCFGRVTPNVVSQVSTATRTATAERRTSRIRREEFDSDGSPGLGGKRVILVCSRGGLVGNICYWCSRFIKQIQDHVHVVLMCVTVPVRMD